MPQKINLVIVVLDGSYLLEEHFETIFEAYLEPILKHMKQQQIIVEKEDKEKKGEVEKNKITPKLKCGLIVFGNYEPISRSPVTPYYFEENLSQFEKLIMGIEFEDGGMRENAVAEGLVAALEMFDAYKDQMKPETPESTEIIRHCLLISNSHPCPDLVHRNLDEKYDQYSMKQIVEEMKNQKIYLSLITPERDFIELEDLVTEVNQGVEVHNATDVINSSHVVKLAGFKPPFTHPKEVSTAQKRKREDSTSSTGTNDQQISSAQNSGNEAKKVKLEPTQELVKDQPPIPNGQLPGQPSQHLQALSSVKKDQTITIQNPSGQQSSNQPPVINTISSAQTTPKLQAPAVSALSTSNTNPTPSQIQIPQNVTQPIKTTNQAASSNVTAVQMQSPALTGTISRPPQRPAFAPQQAIPGSLLGRPQPGVKIPPMHAQFQARLAAMTPEQRSQFFANYQPLRNPLRSALAINNNTQISSRLQNTLLQHELAASQQNLANVLVRNQLGLPLQNGTQVNIGQQQIGNFVTSAASIGEAVSTQALNGFGTSATLNVAVTAQQLSAFNTSTTPTSNSASAAGYTTASTSIGTVNAQFGGNTTSTNSAQLPVSTMMNSISAAGINNTVTGQTISVTTGAIGQTANGGIRPNIPLQKKINALWSGHIAWSANNQGQKRELTCQVTAFPVTTKKNAPLSQIDYMTSYWPDKMEIAGISHSKDVISNASSNPNPKIVYFFPNPNPIQENNNTFGVLMRILEGKKMAAFVRFPNAPNPNGGIVLFTNSGGQANTANTPPKLVGLLFLDTPLPTNSLVLPQGQQQIRPPQATAQHSLLQLQLQQMALRTQQQQQPAMQIQATAAAAVLQQNALQQSVLQPSALQPNVLQQNALQQNALQQNALQQNALQQNALQIQSALQLQQQSTLQQQSALQQKLVLQQAQLQQQQMALQPSMQQIIQQQQQQQQQRRQIIQPLQNPQMYRLYQAARSNTGITDQEFIAQFLRQRQQSQQQPTQ